MNDLTSRQYSNDEVNRIIRRALKLKQEDAISHKDLIDTASEIGIDSKILEVAIEQERREFKKEKLRQARLKRRMIGFYSHMWCYIMVNAGLLLIDYLTPGPGWFQWSVLGWGIGLASHFKAIVFTRGKKDKKEIRFRHIRMGCMMRG
jgi:hypothetical protein